MKSKAAIISRIGSGKVHGYTIRFSDSIKTYFIHSYDSINPKETQKTVNARLKKYLSQLIDEGKI